ncbi:hypothetical protein CA233_12045 [Sphingomonas sp. ABOLD]|uniref:Terminase small subunit n=1 Tax=Sphingomonas trueperi TaxID=53317 RepID=A0A7X6BBG6_9SPHN|nr:MULTISPECIES: hypothetical protein [Sphingomonas]NJB95836.1 hypothetical protein [Sphingomonas trueperi]RSV47125.1 hypothetical protein CA233_12045 [Sphingomonas sp. ABOLD]
MTDVIGKATNRRLQKRKLPAHAWSDRQERAFLDMLAATCNVVRSCKQAKVDHRSAYRRRRENPVFASAWRAAILTGYERLEEQLLAQLAAPHPFEEDGIDEVPPPAGAFDAKLAMELLRMHRATVENRPQTPRGRVVRVSRDEAEAALNKKLDALAKRLAEERGDQP